MIKIQRLNVNLQAAAHRRLDAHCYPANDAFFVVTSPKSCPAYMKTEPSYAN